MTLSAAVSWDAAYPLSNALTDELSRVARSGNCADVANTSFLAVFDDYRRIDVVVLANHNFSPSLATVRVRGFSDTVGSAQVCDSGPTLVWPVVYDEDDAEAAWDTGNAWDRILSELDRENRSLDHAVYIPDSPLVRSVRIDIVDTMNPDGYVQFGICEIAGGTYFPVNFDYGAQYGLQSRTTSVEAAGGATSFVTSAPDNVFKGTISYADHATVLSTFYEFLRRTDKNVIFWWSPDPEDTRNAVRHSFLARHAELDLLTYAVFDKDTVPLSFKKVL